MTQNVVGEFTIILLLNLIYRRIVGLLTIRASRRGGYLNSSFSSNHPLEETDHDRENADYIRLDRNVF
jgi:hypothetical protein